MAPVAVDHCWANYGGAAALYQLTSQSEDIPNGNKSPGTTHSCRAEGCRNEGLALTRAAGEIYTAESLHKPLSLTVTRAPP